MLGSVIGIMVIVFLFIEFLIIKVVFDWLILNEGFINLWYIYICIIIFMNSVYIIFMEIIEFGFCKI